MSTLTQDAAPLPGVPAGPDTHPVTVTVLGTERVTGMGATVALAIVLVLQGVRVVRRPGGSLACLTPQFRHTRSGRWVPAVALPASLSDAVAAEVFATACAGCVP